MKCQLIRCVLGSLGKGLKIEWHSRGRRFDPDQLQHSSIGVGGFNAKPFFLSFNHPLHHLNFIFVTLPSVLCYIFSAPCVFRPCSLVPLDK